jgi:K+-sensing histidine kinase KdpD
MVAAATVLNLLVWPSGSDRDGHYFIVMVAVLVSALYGGLLAGLTSTALGAVSTIYFMLRPQFSILVGESAAVNRLIGFLIEGVLVTLIALLLRSQRDLTVTKLGVQRYTVIPLTVSAATLLKLILPDLAYLLPFAFNYSAVLICARTGGVKSGVIATVLLTGLTRYLFLEPRYSLAVSSRFDLIRVAFFVTEALLLTYLGSRFEQLRRKATNVSARARAYMAAALSKEQDTVAMRAISRDTIWEWGLDTGEILRTPSWRDTLSASLPEREDFVAWVERIHPEDRSATVKHLHYAIEAGKEELHYQYRLRGVDGSFHLVADHAFIVRGADWKPLRVIGRSAELPNLLN